MITVLAVAPYAVGKNGWGAMLRYETANLFLYRLAPSADSLKSFAPILFITAVARIITPYREKVKF